MHNLFWGALIIGIGLVRGSSVFLGDFSFLNILFDGLGLFWLGKGWGILITLAFISFTRIWFRSQTLEGTTEMFDTLFTKFGFNLIPQIIGNYYTVFLMVIFGFLLHWVPTRAKTWVVGQFAKAHILLQAAICIAIVLVIYQFVSADAKPFIYFQF